MVYTKGHWYWVRYKFGTTLSPATPCTIIQGKVTQWWIPFMRYLTPESDLEIEVVAHIPFPEV